MLEKHQKWDEGDAKRGCCRCVCDLMHVDLTDLDSAVTFCGCRVTGRRQVNARVIPVLPRQTAPSAARPDRSTKLHICRTVSMRWLCRCQRVHTSQSASRPREGSGNACDDCAPACKNSDFGRLPRTQIGSELLLIKGNRNHPQC